MGHLDLLRLPPDCLRCSGVPKATSMLRLAIGLAGRLDGVRLQNFIYASTESVPHTKIPKGDSTRAKLDAAHNTPAGLNLSSSLSLLS